MLVVLSPAKKLNLTPATSAKSSTPQFIDEAEKIINTLRKYKPTKLSKLMSISPDLANLNFDRYLNWNSDHSTAKNAVFTFDGEAYTGLNALSFSKKELEYAQDHLRLLSGLYGILKPLDVIHAYRLEMGTKLKIGTKKNLYEYWGDKIVNEINKDLGNQNENVLINLASNEYFKVVNKQKLKAQIITPVFKDFNNGQYKMVMVYAKKARGMMAAYIIKNNIKRVEDLIGFNDAGYCYNAAASTEKEMVFYRG